MGRPKTTDLFVLCAFGLVSITLGVLRSRLKVDVENTSMQSDRTPEAAVEERRDELFGPDRTLLLLLEGPRGPLAGTQDEAAVASWLDALAAAPGVHAVHRLPVEAPSGGVLAAVDLAPDGAEPPSFAPALASALAAARGSAPAGWRMSATGQVPGQVAISKALRDEEARVLPVLAAVLALVLLAIYRSPALVGAAFLPAGGAVLWLGGLQELLDIPLDPIAALLPPTVLTVGVAGAIHLLEGYLHELEQGVPLDEAPRAALAHLFIPVVLAVTTTIAGFIALVYNSLPAVRTFGWLASLGTVLAAAMTLLIVPSWLRVLRPRPSAHRGRTWARIAGPLARWLDARAGLLIAGWGVAGAMSLLAWTHIDVDTEPLRVLPPDHPFRTDTDRIARELGGIETFDLMLEAPHPPAPPLALAGLAGGLSALPGVAGPAGAPRRAADGTWLVPALLRPAGTKQHEEAFAAALSRARDAGWERAEVAGLTVRIARDSQRLVKGQLSGLATSALLIGAMIIAGLRSLRLGVLSMLPNLLACSLIYGALAALGRPLTVATAMIGTVFLGLIVDDTVHFLYCFRGARRLGEDPREAVAHAFRRTGRPISITATTLAAGFAACLSGSLSTSREFGALATAIVLASLSTGLFLLPALLLRSAPSAPSAP